jgi:hypothetical protein
MYEWHQQGAACLEDPVAVVDVPARQATAAANHPSWFDGAQDDVVHRRDDRVDRVGLRRAIPPAVCRFSTANRSDSGKQNADRRGRRRIFPLGALGRR